MQEQDNDWVRCQAAVLRKHTTDAEQVLWQRLRGKQLGVKFRRQHPFAKYVIDFVCLECKLVVEVDGGQHNGSVTDVERDRQLALSGFRVLRFWNNEVLLKTDEVVSAIWEALGGFGSATRPLFQSHPLAHPLPNPPLEGEGIQHQPPLEGEGTKNQPPLEGEGYIT